MTRAPDIVLTLPMPPSANLLQKHRAVRSRATGAPMAVRYSTSDYRAWQDVAAVSVSEQCPGDRVEWRYELRVTIPESRIDPDNRIKPVSDLLQKCGVIANDKHLRRLELVVDPDRTIDRMLVEIWSLGPAPAKAKGRRS